MRITHGISAGYLTAVCCYPVRALPLGVKIIAGNFSPEPGCCERDASAPLPLRQKVLANFPLSNLPPQRFTAPGNFYSSRDTPLLPFATFIRSISKIASHFPLRVSNIVYIYILNRNFIGVIKQRTRERERERKLIILDNSGLLIIHRL